MERLRDKVEVRSVGGGTWLNGQRLSVRTDEFQPVAEELKWGDSIQQTEEEEGLNLCLAGFHVSFGRWAPGSRVSLLLLRKRGFLFSFVLYFLRMGLFQGWGNVRFPLASKVCENRKVQTKQALCLTRLVLDNPQLNLKGAETVFHWLYEWTTECRKWKLNRIIIFSFSCCCLKSDLIHPSIFNVYASTQGLQTLSPSQLPRGEGRVTRPGDRDKQGPVTHTGNLEPPICLACINLDFGN